MNELTRRLAGNPIENMRCAKPPFGCGKDIDLRTEFSDELSKKEYLISGMCQECQDSSNKDEDSDQSFHGLS